MQSDYLYSKNDVFSEDLRLDILKSSEKHFANNLVDGDNGILQITEAIIDCHGLSLSPSSFFPYSERCWNIFCLKIRDLVYEYCDKSDINWSSMTPFSCWGERISYKPFEDVPRPKWEHRIFSRLYAPVDKHNNDNWKQTSGSVGLRNTNEPRISTDIQVHKTFIRCVYYLQTDGLFGTHVETPEVCRHTGVENSVFIFNTSELPNYNILPHNPKTIEKRPPTNIIFDWYINEPFEVPDWILP